MTKLYLCLTIDFGPEGPIVTMTTQLYQNEPTLFKIGYNIIST